jgi:hypothetical protein
MKLTWQEDFQYWWDEHWIEILGIFSICVILLLPILLIINFTVRKDVQTGTGVVVQPVYSAAIAPQSHVGMVVNSNDGSVSPVLVTSGGSSEKFQMVVKAGDEYITMNVSETTYFSHQIGDRIQYRCDYGSIAHDRNCEAK